MVFGAFVLAEPVSYIMQCDFFGAGFDEWPCPRATEFLHVAAHAEDALVGVVAADALHPRGSGDGVVVACPAADLYGGLCYLNNAAIAARELQAAGRVAILDVDYHHGNGTQTIFYDDPGVLYCSLHANPEHEYPYYWGRIEETGAGPGTGTTCNWPLPPRTDDRAYLRALDEALIAVRAFEPRHMVVSMGLDIVEGDAIGGFCVSRNGLQEIARRIAALELRTLLVQEGGYAVDRLGDDAVAFLTPFA